MALSKFLIIDTDFIHLDINECESHPCANGGTCHDRIARFTCTCTTRYTGIQCQTGRQYTSFTYNLTIYQSVIVEVMMRIVYF